MTPADLEFLPAVALAYAIAVFSVATCASAAIVGRSDRAAALLTPQEGRAGCLDGLRGYLALGVLVHHSFAAYGYFVTGRWEWSTSSIFNQFGQTTVALFFMITGYLFSDKLLRSKDKPVQWRRLYESRLLRLTPIYLVSVTAVALSVGALTGFSLREPIGTVLRELADWFLFAIPDRPDINGLPMTWTVMAGVNWSLRYEWYFYASLLLLFWPLRLLADQWPARVAVAALLALLLKSAWSHHPIGIPRLYVVHFACGIASAMVLRDDFLRRVVASMPYRMLAAASLIKLATLASANGGLAAALTWAVFLAVGAGASMFGLLRTRAAIWLGEISYGIYLIHGLVIFWMLFALRSIGLLPEMDVLAYGAIVCAVSATVVALASLSFIFLERPMMNLHRRSSPTRPPR